MTGYEKLKRGDFNTVNFNWQADGTVKIILHKRGEGKIYRVHVKKLDAPDEAVLSDDELPI